MMEIVQFLLFTAFLANAVNSEILSASNVQICMDLCTSCGGTSTFENQVCNCRIPDNDDKASECMKHVQKQQNEKLNLGLLVGQETTNRGTRCSPAKSKKQMRSADVDRVVNYFVNGGPMAGMPIVGSAQTNCETSPENEIISPVENEPEPVSVPKKKVKPATGKNASEQKNVESNATETEMVAAAKTFEEVGEVQDLHAIEPRSFLHHHKRLIGALPHVLFGLPQALATAVAPINGRPYPHLTVPHRPHHYGGRSQYPYLLGAVSPQHYGLHSDHAAPIHDPTNNQQNTHAVPQGSLIAPYVGIRNSLLAGARTPFPHQGLLGAPQYAPVFGLVEPRLGDVQQQYATKTEEEKIDHLEEPKFSQSARKLEEKPSLLHQAIVQQNALLESLNEQLHNYDTAFGASQFKQPLNLLQGAPKSMKQCYCSEQEPNVAATKYKIPQTSERSPKYRSKVVKTEETSTLSSQPEPKKPTSQQTTNRPDFSDAATNPPTKKPQEISTQKSTINADQVPRLSRQSATNHQEYHWQYLPQYLHQFPENAYFTYRKKRGSVQPNDKEKAKILQT